MNAGPAKPVPAPDAWSLPFWEAARERRLVMQRCKACERMQYPPDVICRRCQSDELDFVEVSGRGAVQTFAIYTRSFMAGYEAPYALALIRLEDDPELRMMTNILDTPLDAIEVGMPVVVTYEERGDWTLPQFRAAGAIQ